MNNKTQHHTSSNVFLVLSLLLVPIFYFTEMTNDAIGPVIYVYIGFALLCYKALHNKHIFQMIRVIGLSPLAFCIIMTPIYFIYHLYYGTLLENSYTIGHVISAWFNVMLQIIAIGYLHVFAILMLFVGFYLFSDARRL